MKNTLLFLVTLLMLGGAGQWQAVHAQTHSVTFILNTATVPDTIPVTGSTIQIRGSSIHNSPITWGNDVQNNMTSIGGDYWSKTVTLSTNDTVNYKYVINYMSGTGWENDLTAPYPGSISGNRKFIVPDADTVVPVEFWNNGAGGRPQYFRPWADHSADSMVVYFRVSMHGPISSGSFLFHNDVDTVGVRGGGGADAGELHWAPTFYLTRESNASNGDGYTIAANGFWSGAVRIPKANFNAGDVLNYKFLIGYDWGRDERQGGSNRSFNVPVGKKDTTLQWVFFNDERPSQLDNPDTVIITYVADMGRAISTGGFNIGDTLQVRSGYFGTTLSAGKSKAMEQLLANIYSITDTIVTKIGRPMDYQYYVHKNGVDVRESYYNFYYSGPTNNEAERRQFAPPGATCTVYDSAASVIQARRKPVFPNSRTLSQPVSVKYEVNIKPVFVQIEQGDTLHDIAGTFNVHEGVRDSITIWGVWLNGLAVGGWGNPGTTDWDFGLFFNLDKKMWDDGTHGDLVAGDSIYTITVQCAPESLGIGTKGQIGQVFKFGIKGGDNEGGKGGYGNNHLENISDAQSTFVLHSQFGSTNPAFYCGWDYDKEQPSNIRRVSYDLTPGWKMVSLPVTLGNMAVSAVFPTASGTAYKYTTSYVGSSTLETKVGYWVKIGSAMTNTVQGVADPDPAVHAGWNMLGGPGVYYPVAKVTSIPPGIVTSNWFYYNGIAYVVATTLEPGRAYWVKCNQAGNLFYTPPPPPAGLIKIVPDGEMPPPPPGEGLTSTKDLPKEYSLGQNYPSPFNPTTTIKYQLPFDSKVSLKVYNMLGQVVATLIDGEQAAGYKEAEWSAVDMASGVYIYRMEATSLSEPGKTFTDLKKTVLLK